jgi:4-amino-4-deoxychorismate lyase
MNGFDTIFYYKEFQGDWQVQPLFFHNRAFMFGDGLFETMIYHKGSVRFASHHFSRMMEGCFQLGLDPSFISPIENIELLLAQAVRSVVPIRVRWNVFRSGMGKYTPEENQILESLVLQKFLPAPQVKEYGYISNQIHVSSSPWSHCKTLNALTYVMANRERASKSKDEVILTDSNDHISESGVGNVFWKKNNNYFTPSLASSCIAGVARRNILEYFEGIGKPVEEGLFKKDDLLQAEQVLISNAAGISYLKNLEGQEFDVTPDPFLLQLFDLNQY